MQFAAADIWRSKSGGMGLSWHRIILDPIQEQRYSAMLQCCGMHAQPASNARHAALVLMAYLASYPTLPCPGSWCTAMLALTRGARPARPCLTAIMSIEGGLAGGHINAIARVPLPREEKPARAAAIATHRFSAGTRPCCHPWASCRHPCRATAGCRRPAACCPWP